MSDTTALMKALTALIVVLFAMLPAYQETPIPQAQIPETGPITTVPIGAEHVPHPAPVEPSTPPTEVAAPPPTLQPPPPRTDPAPQAPIGPAVPVGSTELFVADYETGDFSQWGSCHSVGIHWGDPCDGPAYPGGQIVSGAEATQGNSAAHFTLADGDVPASGGGERSEVMSHAPGALTHEGDERWYEWSMKVNSEFQPPQGWGLILMQWHAGHGSPPLAVKVDPQGDLFLYDLNGEGQRMGPVPAGQWKNYVLHVKFSSDASTGFIEAWENGVQVVSKTNRATMSSGENFLKQGLYRDEVNTVTHEVWMDGLRVTAP